MPVISRIESIGGGRVGGGWGEAGEGGKPKAGQSNHLDSSSSAVPFSMGPELVQSTGWAETADRSSLVPHAVLLMPLRAKKCFIVV